MLVLKSYDYFLVFDLKHQGMYNIHQAERFLETSWELSLSISKNSWQFLSGILGWKVSVFKTQFWYTMKTNMEDVNGVDLF